MSEAPIARRILERIRQQLRSKVVDLSMIRAWNEFAEALQNSVVTPETLRNTHPAHSIYLHVQNQMSVMAEQLLGLPEMRTFAKIIGAAHDEYMPSWPPMSPISTSYFWCWSNFDATANAHRETLGSVTLRIAAEFGVHRKMLSLMQSFNNSRMSLYRVEGHTDACVQLRDLVTNQPCLAACESGYAGNAGEIWFTRVLPPALTGQSEHVVFTSPYVLISPDATGWRQYLDRIAAKDPCRSRVEALGRHLKWGTTRRYWPEFVFEGYVSHHPGAIFLKGLPDVPESRPHSREYVRHADEH
ncbi:MAG: hypothetical protein ABI145_08590 [Steroidobacteraceae bacterium]